MAEAAPAPTGGGLDIRRLLLMGGVGVVIVFAVIFLLFRGCAATGGRGGSDYTVIYSNLGLKDAANVVARLKELAIPYELKDQGRSIAVQKNRSDQARLGLAEENLPAGGVVGWEIFDETKLGATDFDRRIQLIRAISGELSRTIRRINAVEDARVQVVMPETRLFETVKAPVTASVLLKLRPGAELIPTKIRGIVHLVSSSVENLQTENVTVVDNNGRILTTKTILEAPDRERISIKKIVTTPKDIIITAEVEAITKVATAPLSAEEKIMLKVKAKKRLEVDLAGKAQEILNRFYPPNSVIIKVNVELKNSTDKKSAKYELKVGRLTAVILVDNRIELTPELKSSTYKSVAAAVGYDRKRGDKIIMQKVPFHLATPPPEVMKAEVQKVFPPEKNGKKSIDILPISGIKYLPWIGGGVLLLLLVVLIIKRIGKKRPPEKLEMTEFPAKPEEPAKGSEVDAIKSAAANNPEKIAELLKSWLTK
ncbi:MAG: flagellar basal-body MS-ring/collar protein FliF [Candidatus Margulisiibacteriota bacterium]|nr:flagellar basal-body MS-ring/collar protein FliF [Candidatus Margulisiibacteriota bacterium]